MEAGELKSELAALDSKGRRQMIAFLLALEEQNNQEYREELARRIDDPYPILYHPLLGSMAAQLGRQGASLHERTRWHSSSRPCSLSHQWKR